MKKSLIVFLIFLCGCSTSQVKTNLINEDLLKKIVVFWEFVEKNENELFNAFINEQTVNNEIIRQINLINENLYVFMNTDIINDKIDIVISGGGNTDYFELCDRIVEMAPNLVKFNPISLIPPTEEISIYAIGDLTLNLEDIQVHFDSGDNIDLLFILSNNHLSRIQNDNSGQLRSIYMHALFLMTLEILGERITGNKINSADIAPLPIIIMPIVPFIELKKYID